MRVIAIAGPYRAPSEWEVTANIRRAEAVALAVWKLGAAALCPHKNTAYFGGAAPDEVWLEGALEMLRRCDAVLAVEGWQKSEGATLEITCAQEASIPVFYELETLENWLKSPA